MTIDSGVPDLETLLVANVESVNALLQFIGQTIAVERHKQIVDTHSLQQCLLSLSGSGDKDLLVDVSAKLEVLETLSPYQYAIITLVENIFHDFLNQPVFCTEYRELLRQLGYKIAATALASNGWLYNRQHPLRFVLNALYDVACGWDIGLGRAGENTLHFLQSLISAVELDWQSTQQSFINWQHHEQQRIEKLEQRLIASEAGAMKARRSRQLATITLNQLLIGKKLPVAIIEFIHGHWFQSLQLALIQGGERSELWFRQRKLSETLIWSVQPIKDDAHRQQLFRVVGQIGDELRDTLISLAHQADKKDEVLTSIEQTHLQLMQNAELIYNKAPLIGNLEPLLDSNISISQALMARVNQLSIGQWFEFAHENQHKRLKLLIKDDESQQLLFVNQLGIKVLEQSFEEFAYRLASSAAVVLTGNTFDQCIEHVLTSIHGKMQIAMENAARIAAEQRIKIAAEQRARELARVKAEQEAAALAVVLAAKEAEEQEKIAAAETARILAEEQHRATLLAAQGVDDASRQQRARLIASSLTIGAWIEYRSKTGETEKLKLAVILPTSGKCIFVDRNGIKKLELLRDDLIQNIVNNSISLLNTGQQFEDTLARVVGGLRRDRNL